jgi:colanic acid/amylovoran biosynthesis glycosyltransferase
VVLTQRLENPGAFPFDPVYDLTRRLSPIQRAWNRLSRWLGSFYTGPYRDVAGKEGIDLFHAHTGWEAARTAPAARAIGIPLVASFYGRDVSALPRNPYWRTLYRRLFRLADLFLVEGPHLGESLKNLGCPPDKVRVIHLGVDLEKIPFRRRELPQETIRILMSCSLREKKGVGYALEALARCRDTSSWKLRILGDGPLREDLEERIRTLGLKDRAAIEGYVPYQVHLEALHEADLFLSPSVTASDGDAEGGAPVALIEAQAAGLPVVASRHCDIPEVVQDGVTGLLVPERDVDALANAIQSLLSDPSSWAPLGRAGRDHVEQEFNVQRQVERTEKLYLELLELIESQKRP